MECLSAIGSFLSGIAAIGLYCIARSWEKQLVPDARKEAIKYIAYLNANLKSLSVYLKENKVSYNNVFYPYLVNPNFQILNEKISENLILIKSSILHIISLENGNDKLSDLLDGLMKGGDDCIGHIGYINVQNLLKLNNALLNEVMNNRYFSRGKK